MTRRILAGAGALVLSIAIFVTAAPAAVAAPAQDGGTVRCFPSDFVDYPPAGPSTQLIPGSAVVRARLLPGVQGTIAVRLRPNEVYCGRLFSTPVDLSPTQSDGQGVVEFAAPLPRDFELNALHHLDVFQAGVLVGAFDFCVQRDGTIGPVSDCGGSGALPKTKSLARTGTEPWEIVRVALVLIAAGVLAVYVYRRRAGPASAAS